MGSGSRSPESAVQPFRLSRALPVGAALRASAPRLPYRTRRARSLSLYVAAFDDLDYQVVAVVGGGADALALETTDGTVLKLHRHPLPDAAGERPFDTPLLARGERRVHAWTAYYHVQPLLLPASADDLPQMWRAITAAGFRWWDPGVHNIGRDPGSDRVLLLDYWSVIPHQPHR
jgi:hypothetical protein